jgi:integrase
MTITYDVNSKKGNWKVLWKNMWTGKKRIYTFSAEEDAQKFLDSQKIICEREKLLLKKNRNPIIHKQNNITVKELSDKYFNLSQSSSLTIKQSKYHIAHVLSALGGRQVQLLLPQDILSFSEAQRIRGIAQSTVNRRVSILKAAINWGVQNELLNKNPLANLRMPHAKSHRISPPTAQESNDLLAVAAPHVQRVIILGMSLGARIGPSELFSLTWRDVDLDNANIRMPNAKKNKNFDDSRDIPIRKTLLPLMRKWYEYDSKKNIKHVISWGGHPVRNIERAWHTALRKAGIERRIRPYDLRHAYATYSLAGGADIGSVANIMGHSDPSMILKVYQHVQDTQKRAAVETLPDILNLKNHKNKRTGLPDKELLQGKGEPGQGDSSVLNGSDSRANRPQTGAEEENNMTLSFFSAAADDIAARICAEVERLRSMPEANRIKVLNRVQTVLRKVSTGENARGALGTAMVNMGREFCSDESTERWSPVAVLALEGKAIKIKDRTYLAQASPKSERHPGRQYSYVTAHRQLADALAGTARPWRKHLDAQVEGKSPLHPRSRGQRPCRGRQVGDEMCPPNDCSLMRQPVSHGGGVQRLGAGRGSNKQLSGRRTRRRSDSPAERSYSLLPSFPSTVAMQSQAAP